jgi:hypothetical protein
MKYLKTKNISKHSISDRSFIVEQPNGKITTNSRNSIKIPTGEINRRPETPDQGMIRFTTNDTADHEDSNIDEFFGNRPVGLEAYFDGEWRPVRLQGPATINQYNAGQGNWDAGLQPNEDLSRFFPISGEPLPVIPLSGNNVIVLVENVMQISGTNFDLIESQGEVFAVQVTTGGTGLTPNSTTIPVTFSAPGTGTTAQGLGVADATGELTEITITNPGSGYTSAPTVTVTGETGPSSYTVKITKPGWHLEFLSAVPDEKTVTVYFGFDQ